MTPNVHSPVVSAASARQRAAQAEAIKEAWRAGQQDLDAAAALRANPEIAADRAVALDLAYEEFCTREETGERLDSAAFCAQFSFGASLRRLLTLHRFLDNHPVALGAATPTKWPAAGEQVADFQILRELGRGGFSRVYLAVETTAGNRSVALKVSAAGSTEAATLGPLSHPHLTHVLSSPRVGPWTIVAMPFVGTATLEDVLSVGWKSGRAESPRSAGVLLEAAAQGYREDDPPFHSNPDFAIHAKMSYEAGVTAIAAKLFAAVAYLHEKGVAHRDLKPSNVLLGPTCYPYLLDFNLATQVADPWRLAGTLPYMAPEQLALIIDPTASPPTDWKPADVFACGVILFELLTGRHPFRDPGTETADSTQDRAARSLRAAQQAGPPSLSSLNRRLRRTVRETIERCLALDPNARPTAAELAKLFARLASRRSRWRFALPALIVGALALVYFAPWRQEPQPQPPDPPPVVLPTNPFDRGVLLFHQGQDSLAITEFLEAGEKNKDGRAYACAAYCLSIRKDHKDAAAAATAAIRLGYRTAPVYANRAYNNLQTGKFKAAKDDCDEALRLDPNLRAAWLTRATVHLRMHQSKKTEIPMEAVEDIDRVTASQPTSPDVWLIAAAIYVVAPDKTPAMRDKAAQAVQAAVRNGKSREFILRDPVVHAALKGHPVYEDALKLQPGPAGSPADPHLTNVIP